MTPNHDRIFASLDVGTTKIVCLIAELVGGELAVRGVGLCAADGMAAGSVRDLARLEQAIRTAVSKAEKMARMTVTEVTVSFSGGQEQGDIIEVEVPLIEGYVTEGDIARVEAAAAARLEEQDGRATLHVLPAAYALDGQYDRSKPLGLYGKTLGLSVHVVTVREGPLKNLEMAVRRAQLDIRDVVLSSFASGLAVMVDDEMTIGAACVDMGAGSTGLTLYALGSLVHVGRLGWGSDGLTEKIMRTLLTSRDGAEGLKVRSGAAICEAGDANQQIDVDRIGEQESDVVEARSVLTTIMQRDYEEGFEHIADLLAKSGFSGVAGQRVVLVGGAAQATRLRDLAEKILGRDVRIGEPRDITGLPENVRGAGFACAVGLLKYAAGAVTDLRGQGLRKAKDEGQKGPLKRLFRWLKESF